MGYGIWGEQKKNIDSLCSLCLCVNKKVTEVTEITEKDFETADPPYADADERGFS